MGSAVGTKKRYGSVGTGSEVSSSRMRVGCVKMLFIFLFTCHGRININNGLFELSISWMRKQKPTIKTLDHILIYLQYMI